MTRPSGPDFVLSTHEFDILWWALDFGRIPYPLEVPRIGRTPEQRAEFANEVYRELGDRGLMTGAAVDDGLVSALRLLTCYHVAVDVVGDIGYPVRALAAAGSECGVLAVLAGGELWLTRVSSTALAAAITGVLPRCAPGTGPEKSLPCAAFGEAGDPLGEAIAAAGLGGGRRRSGLFGASTGDHRRSVTPVVWVDTEEGRYVMARNGSALHVAPGDKAALERHVATILAEVSVVPAQPGASAAPGVWGHAPSGGA
ncbi:ESX secretion-associated protein EspG, partial [Amycolatopsis pigmentata]